MSEREVVIVVFVVGLHIAMFGFACIGYWLGRLDERYKNSIERDKEHKKQFDEEVEKRIHKSTARTSGRIV